MSESEYLWRLPAVIERVGHKRSSIYAQIERGEFIKPVRLGKRASAWPASEVIAINRARIAGMTNDEIRALVVKLHTARKQGAASAVELTAVTP